MFGNKRLDELEAENRRLKRVNRELLEKGVKAPVKSTLLDEWVIHVDSENRIKYINSTLAKDLNLNREALREKDLSEIDHVFGKGKLKTMIDEAKIAKKTIESEPVNYKGKIYQIKALVYNESPQIIIDDVTKLSNLEKLLKQNVDPSVIEDLIERGVNIFKNEKKNITILFGDIRGFTKYSGNAKPEEVRDVLNDYFNAMTEIVKSEYKGTVDKFIGDKIMAYFGAPKDMLGSTDIAVKAAIDMQYSQKKLKEKWASEGKPMLGIGIGINTGEVMVGPFGSDKRYDYTIIGGNVNLADRICGIAEPNEILISNDTYEGLNDKMDFKDIGEKTFKGIEKPVKVYSKK